MSERPKIPEGKTVRDGFGIELIAGMILFWLLLLGTIFTSFTPPVKPATVTHPPSLADGPHPRRGT